MNKVSNKLDLMDTVVAQTVKASTYNVGDPVRSLGREDLPGEGNGNPLLHSCLEKSKDVWRNLVAYSPWCPKESGMTERPHFHFHR